MSRWDRDVERWWEAKDYPMPSIKEEEAIRLTRLATIGICLLAAALTAAGVMAARWLGV